MPSLRKLRNSFVYAWLGLKHVVREEQNFRIQVWIAALVIIAMFVLDVSRAEKAILVLATAFVLVLELVNSIFERIVDLLKPRLHETVKEVKDIMAGAVLLAAIGAALIGTVLFLPYLKELLP